MKKGNLYANQNPFRTNAESTYYLSWTPETTYLNTISARRLSFIS